jgi:hypothetical protein
LAGREYTLLKASAANTSSSRYILKAQTVKITVFWDATPCCFVGGYKHFRATGTYKMLILIYKTT